MDSHWARLGDKITLRHVEEYGKYYNPQHRARCTAREEDIPEGAPFAARAVKYRDLEYEVAALVSVPTALSYRYYYGADEFILNDQTFLQDTGTADIMYTPLTWTTARRRIWRASLRDYTENVNPQLDYESKATYAAEFEGFRGCS